MKNSIGFSLTGLALAVAVASPVLADNNHHGAWDFGQYRDHMLNEKSLELFGI